MPLPKKLSFNIETYYIDKTGFTFFDIARLIGSAHLFFGTASAEIEDKGAYWEIKGINVKRDENQVLWAVERLSNLKSERDLFYKRGGRTFLGEEFSSFFKQIKFENRRGRKEEIKAEYDASLQIGTRGIDPLANYKVLAPRFTGEAKKKFKIPFQQKAIATLGRAFAAHVTGQIKGYREEIYILPVFRERFVLSSFLEYKRTFKHQAGGFVASVWAALSILFNLTLKRLPVVDFVYTREVKQGNRPIFSNSGYMGFEHLCSLWQEAIREEREEKIKSLQQIYMFLLETHDKGNSEQVQNLARQAAEFAAKPDVNTLTTIQRLKARIQASLQNRQRLSNEIREAVYQLFSNSEIIKEVGNMVVANLSNAPWQIIEAVAQGLSLDEKGWMNQLTRLENATSFSIFIAQVEHIVSRGFYREQQEGKKNIQEAIKKAKDLSTQLNELASQLKDDKTFRAFKAIFLLDVLSRMKKVYKESTQEGGA